MIEMIGMIFEFQWPGRDTAFLNLSQGLGLASYFIVIGYEFLLFCYFLLIKWRETRKLYWMYFSLFFLFIAVSRGLFVIYDYMMPYFIDMIRTDPLIPLQLYRWANFIGWLAAACMVGVISTLIFTQDNQTTMIMRIVTPSIIVVIGSLFLFLPAETIIDGNFYIYSDPFNVEYEVSHGLSIVESPIALLGIGTFVLTFIITPIISFILPFIFFYLGLKSVGVIRKSSILNGLGFILYWFGRFATPFFSLTQKPGGGAWSGITINVWPPMIILMGLLFLALANMMLQQK